MKLLIWNSILSDLTSELLSWSMAPPQSTAVTLQGCWLWGTLGTPGAWAQGPGSRCLALSRKGEGRLCPGERGSLSGRQHECDSDIQVADDHGWRGQGPGDWGKLALGVNLGSLCLAKPSSLQT